MFFLTWPLRASSLAPPGQMRELSVQSIYSQRSSNRVSAAGATAAGKQPVKTREAEEPL